MYLAKLKGIYFVQYQKFIETQFSKPASAFAGAFLFLLKRDKTKGQPF
jgi:hypothetical protein